MDEFEKFWQESAAATANAPVVINENTPEYQIKDGIARLLILADMTLEYFYSKHGKPLKDDDDDNETPIEFHLK